MNNEEDLLRGRQRSDTTFRKTAVHVTSSKNCDSENGSDNNKNNGVYVHIYQIYKNTYIII